MIAYLRGKILNILTGSVILDVRDTGYKVFVGSTASADFKVGQTVEFYIHQHIREDALDLYGFKTVDELEMFELLLSISGIGPKSALGALAIAGVQDIKSAIAQGDPSLLIKVSGIGKKTAERVVLELREKVVSARGASESEPGGRAMVGGDEIDALMALGYSVAQAREALNGINPEIKDSGKRIKEALKKMGN